MTEPSETDLELWPANGLGMDHPHVAAVIQANMDAEIAHAAGRTREETLPRTIDRLKDLFGEDVPVRRIAHAIRVGWEPEKPERPR